MRQVHARLSAAEAVQRTAQASLDCTGVALDQVRSVLREAEARRDQVTGAAAALRDAVETGAELTIPVVDIGNDRVVEAAAELAGEYRDGLRELGKLKARLVGMQNLTRPRAVEPGAPWRPPEPLRFLASTRGVTGRSVPAADDAIKAGEDQAREYLERLRADPEAVSG